METVAEKVAHVRAAKQDRDHDCHWPGCGKKVPPAMWGCTGHWKALPGNLRREIWLTYRVGQEVNGRPSAAYVEVARKVQDWIATKVEQKLKPKPDLFATRTSIDAAGELRVEPITAEQFYAPSPAASCAWCKRDDVPLTSARHVIGAICAACDEASLYD